MRDARGADASLAVGALATALCLLWLAVALLATRGAPPLTPDSTEYALIARSLAAGEGYRIPFVGVHLGLREPLRHVPEMHGLLQPFLLAGLFAVAGPDPALVRIPGLVAVAATALLIFGLGQRLFGPGPALAACLLALVQPFAFVLAWSGNDDPVAMALLVASLVALHRALDAGRERSFALAGLLGGLALAEKGTALLLLPVLAWPLWLYLRGRAGVTPRRLAWLVGPAVLVFSLYLLRNLVSHGDLSARFAVANWLWKSAEVYRLESYFALHESLPSLAELMRSLGVRKLASDAVAQLELTAGWLLRLGPLLHWSVRDAGLTMPGFVAPVGLLALLALRRRRPHFAALLGLALLGAIALICGLYHASLRFFLFLAPLLGLAAAGLLDALGRRGRAGRSAAWALGACVVGAGSFAWAQTAVFGPRLVPTRTLGPCQALLRDFVATTPPETRLLSFAPWSVAWETGREALQIPSSGPEAIVRVARHYGAEWILAQPHPERPLTLRALQLLEQSGAAGWHARVARRSPRCTLLHLEPMAEQP